ncbi:MAG: hypothetical protein M0Z99_32055 [Betaproteobacteria bacterium]|nr:hypothetical protein [Betaproteobacteria bacterium]
MIAQPAPQSAPVPPPAAGQPPAAAPAAQPAGAAPSVNPQDLERFVLAGEQLMYHEKARAYFIADLKREGDPTDILAASVIGIIGILDDKTTGGLPRALIAPIAVALLVEAAHFAAQAGYFVMPPKAIMATAQKIMVALMQKYGVIDAIKAAKGRKDAQAQQPAPAAPTQPAPPAAAPGGLITSAGA